MEYRLDFAEKLDSGEYWKETSTWINSKRASKNYFDYLVSKHPEKQIRVVYRDKILFSHNI